VDHGYCPCWGTHPVSSRRHVERLTDLVRWQVQYWFTAGPASLDVFPTWDVLQTYHWSVSHQGYPVTHVTTLVWLSNPV
jgi:hypothetical protein